MINYVNFHPNGVNMVTCSKDMTIKLWSRQSGDYFKCYKTLQGHEHEVSCAEYSVPSGEFILSCSRDNTIRLWDTNTGFLMNTLTQHNDWVRKIT